jgi:hypothetical protein
MAGHPKTTRGLARLAAYPEVQAKAMQLLATGRAVADIAYELGLGNLALHRWLHDPVRSAEVAEARRAGAAKLAEETVAIADGAMPVTDANGEPVADPSRDKLRIATRQWVAERRDRQTWGTPKDTVTVNIGALHLDALRARRTGTVVEAGVAALDVD